MSDERSEHAEGPELQAGDEPRPVSAAECWDEPRWTPLGMAPLRPLVSHVVVNAPIVGRRR
jgi:hypothetical protein